MRQIHDAMPADGNQSPRAAIRNWLLHNTSSGRCTRGSDRTSEQKIKQQTRNARFEIYGSPQQSTLWAGGCRSPEGTKPRLAEEGLFNSETHGQKSGVHVANLADRLDLRAPFRAFGDCHRDPSRKRRRIISSSSLLELAENDSSREGGHTAPTRMALDGSHKQSISRPDSLPPSEDSPSGLVGSSKNPTNMYEKRSRHKTRGDKYSLKENRKARKQMEDDNGKKAKRRKRREKMGKIVMHDFSASNVTQDRLTYDFDLMSQMRPAASLGLFRKGKASSPIRRRGYPEFSEAAFLNCHKQGPNLPDESLEGTRKRRKKGKAAETEAEISRYFTSKVPGACWAPGGAEEKERQAQTYASLASEERHRCGNVETSSELPPPIEMPYRPFLGFGSSGPCLSPVKPPHDLSSFQEKPLPESCSFPTSTSYYTWSQSSIHSCSPVRRCREGLMPSVDLEAASPAQQHKQCIEQPVDSMRSVDPEAREGGDRINKYLEEHVEQKLYHNQKQSRVTRCASNTKSLEPSKSCANDHVTNRNQPMNGCCSAEELQKNLLRVDRVAKANRRKSKNVERGPSPRHSPEPLVHCNTVLSFDAAFGDLPHTFQADPSKRYELIAASEDQTLSSRSPAKGHLGSDVVGPTGKGGDNAPHTIHEDERGRSKDSSRSSPLQDYCSCSPALSAESNFQPPLLRGQDTGHKSIASTPAATFVSVENSRRLNGPFARNKPASYQAPSQQRFEYSGGAWNAYESMYENQKTNERWHNCSFDDGVWTSHGRAYEPKPGPQSDFPSREFAGPEDLDEEQVLSHQFGPTEELGDLTKVTRQPYIFPQGPATFDNNQPAHVGERFLEYHSTADMGSLTHDCASLVTEENPLSNFWKPNRLY